MSASRWVSFRRRFLRAVFLCELRFLDSRIWIPSIGVAPKLLMRMSYSICKISSSRIRVFHNGVAQCGVTCQSLLVHPSQHWHQHISVIVNLDFFLILMESMATANILL